MAAFLQGNKFVGYLALCPLLLWQQSISAEDIGHRSKASSLLFSVGLSSKLENNVDARLTNVGYSAIEKADDGNGIGFSLGYRRFFPSKRWSVDFEYLSLGKRSTKISSVIVPAGKTTTQVLNDVANALPEYGQGLGLMTSRHIQINPSWTGELGMGVILARTSREAKLGAETLTLKDRSVKPMLMLGIRHQLTNRSSVRVVARRFFRDGDDIDQLAIGFTKDF